MVEIHIERGSLDNGVAMVCKRFGRRVRMLFDPRKITEAIAVSFLRILLPHLADGTTVIRSATA